MKVTGVEISSDNANIINFGMSDVSSSDKYLVKSIFGLDADEVIRKFYSFASNSNAKFYNFSMKKREIVFRIILNPNYSINEDFSEIRDEIYRSISSSRTGLINILFRSGGAAVAQISGYFTKFEVPYFSKIPELQITINCDDFMLRGFNPVEIEADVLGATNHIYVSDSISTAPHGMSFSIEYTATSNYFEITDDLTNKSWHFKVSPSGGFLTGDVLEISSEYNSRNVQIIRGATTIPIMDSISYDSSWPLIFPGSNEFEAYDKTKFNWVYVSYYPAYWGL
jgi:hypothetical protein